MAVLTCKICGGDIISTGIGYGVCDSCGTEVTLPVINDTVIAEYYNRGNHFRENREFDQAYKEFEHIIAQDSEDAEAHWSLVLCKYGVVYEKNLHTGAYDLIVTNIRQEPIFEDIDYRRTLKCCDEHAKTLYRAEAGKIDDFVDRYYALVRKTEPYDIFLCVNEENSKAASVAQTVCMKLTEKGLRVFRQSTLQSRDSTVENESHIAYALNSAKLMFLIAADNEDLNTPHIRQQWLRFLDDTGTDRSKKIIPVYTGTTLAAIPRQIPVHEAICADLPGYWQDLTWGALQLLGKAQKPAIIDEGTQFLEEAKKSFEEENYTAASIMAEQALNYDPNNAFAHYYALLSKHKACNFYALFHVNEDWANSAPLQRIINLDQGDLGKQAQEFRTEYINRTSYHKATELMEKGVYGEALSIFESLGSYRDVPTLRGRCRELRHHQVMLQQYRFETNNMPHMHLLNKIQRDHKDVYDALLQKLTLVHEAPRVQIPIWKLLLCLILIVGPSLAILLSSLLIRFSPYFEFTPIIAGPVFMVMCVCYGWGIRKSKFKGLCMLFAGYMAFSVFIGTRYDGVDNLIISIFPILHFIKEYNKQRNFTQYWDDLNRFTEDILIPLEKNIVSDIKSRYGDVLTPEEIGEFYSVKPLLIQSMKFNIPQTKTR